MHIRTKKDIDNFVYHLQEQMQLPDNFEPTIYLSKKEMISVIAETSSNPEAVKRDFENLNITRTKYSCHGILVNLTTK